MPYGKVVEGIFSKKLNRFVAEVYINGELEEVHIKNTGRLKEILRPGATVALETSNNPNRKTKYSIIAGMKGDVWINIDSQIPNAVVHDAILAGKVEAFQGLDHLKREAAYQGSRFDLFYTRENQPGFIEVKGVTLEQDGLAMFPDAPTVRGTKHVETLVEAVDEGYEATIFFVVQMKGCRAFTPNRTMDHAFYETLKHAFNEGVQLIAYDCLVTESTIQLDEKIPIIL